MNVYHLRDSYIVVQKWSIWKEKLYQDLLKVHQYVDQRVLVYLPPPATHQATSPLSQGHRTAPPKTITSTTSVTTSPDAIRQQPARLFLLDYQSPPLQKTVRRL